MKFIKKDKPKIGDRRIIKKFLLFPKCLKNKDGKEETRWLKNTFIEQERRELHGFDRTMYYSWVDIKWSERPKTKEKVK